MDTPIPDYHAGELRLLVVEDSESDAKLAIWGLREAGFNCTYRCVESEAAMRTALRADLPDLILSDFSLPRFDGMSALAVAISEAPNVPFIFLTGMVGEELAIEALKCGAIDYVLKSNPMRLAPAVKRALKDAKLRQKSHAAEQKVTRLTGVLQMLSGINTALVRIHDRDELLQETCRLAHKVGGYAIAIVALINPITRLARPLAWAGPNYLPDPAREFPVADTEANDQSLMGRVIRTGETTVCQDVAGTPLAIDGRGALVAVGVNSLACLPLKVDNTPVGSFLFGARARGAISQDELLLLEEVASNLSFALQYLETQDNARFLSYFEPLTGLAKRALFCERLTRLLTHGTPGLPRLAITVFDIDHLSVINDSFGRHTGDRLLQCVSDRLKGHYPDTEQLAHLGGGTFVSVSALAEQSEDEFRTLHHEVVRVFDRPFRVDGREIIVTVKCGVACYPDNGQEPDELVQNAEAALKEAKTSGEQYLHHRIEMNSDLARRVGIEHRLRSALENNEFVLHYQPKVTLLTGKIASVEALLRWNDGENGLMAPATFLSILESAGLMSAVGAWVVRQAAADCRSWRSVGRSPIRIAVNVSPPELRRRNFAREILSGIGDLTGDSEWGVDIEITEGALFGDSSSCVHSLRLLRAAGVRVAIDDFGTGFSSLGRLSELPVDTLKIDRMFTSRLPSDRKSCTLVTTIIGLAHAFDMTTVAEGVETQAQLDYLIREGCDESQGYLHSRPLPRDELERLLGFSRPALALTDAAEPDLAASRARRSTG
ncbi:MAG TPA: EAL domain-containing protein [Steroidobacteraceae bacterium]